MYGFVYTNYIFSSFYCYVFSWFFSLPLGKHSGLLSEVEWVSVLIQGSIQLIRAPEAFRAPLDAKVMPRVTQCTSQKLGTPELIHPKSR